MGSETKAHPQRWDNFGNRRSAMDRAGKYLTLPYPSNLNIRRLGWWLSIWWRWHMDAKNLLSPDPIRESGDVLSAWLNMNYYLLLSNCQALPESPDVDATYSKGCDRYVIERRELQVFWIYDSRVWVSYDHAHLARWRSEYFSRKIVCRTGCLLRWSATSLGSRSAWAPVFYLAVHM